MSESKIELKIGSFSFSGTGSEEWLSEKLNQIIDSAENLASISNETQPAQSNVANQNANLGQYVESSSLSHASNVSSLEKLSTNTIATRFSSKTCKELALCAAVHLHFFQNKDTFSYDDIRLEMKTAKSFYKQTMKGSNLQAAIDGLVKDKTLNECSPKTYAFCANATSELEARLVAA